MNPVMYKEYLTVGAGGVSFLLLVWLMVFLVRKLHPTLEAINRTNAEHAQVITNNTDAIKEMAKSNDNVATALKLLENSFETISKMLERHDRRAEEMATKVIEIRECVRRD